MRKSLRGKVSREPWIVSFKKGADMRPEDLPLKKQIEVWAYTRNGDSIKYLILRRVPELGGFWQPITGGIERGEGAEHAARRELTEETGIFKPLKFYNLHFNYCFIWKNKRYLEHVFAAESPVMDIKISDEHSAYMWADFNTAASMLRWEANRLIMGQLNDILVSKATAITKAVQKKA
jgi:8-oxo-dGTP pyrophosphatase MutT (NUDIX family)